MGENPLGNRIKYCADGYVLHAFLSGTAQTDVWQSIMMDKMQAQPPE